jgi:hypothetical protein
LVGGTPEYPKTFTNIPKNPKLYQNQPTGFQEQLATIMLKDDRWDIDPTGSYYTSQA